MAICDIEFPADCALISTKRATPEKLCSFSKFNTALEICITLLVLGKPFCRCASFIAISAYLLVGAWSSRFHWRCARKRGKTNLVLSINLCKQITFLCELILQCILL